MIRNIARGVGAFTSNAFLVEGDRIVLVDTGNNFDAVERIRDETGDLDAIVLTHTHPDHVGNVGAISEAFGVDVWGFDADVGYVDHGIADGDTLTLGDDEYVALYTPGHATDHLCLYSRSAGVLFAGDLVFANGGFGRTDLPGSDRSTLIQSIEYVLETVDEPLSTMYTGHGPAIDSNSNPRHDVELALQAARIG